MNILPFKKFISQLKSIELSIEEKNSLRSDFFNKTGINPVKPSFLYSYSIAFRYTKIVGYSFVLFVVGLSPVAFAAHNSSPGDTLYPFKVAVNEPVQKTIAQIGNAFTNQNSFTESGEQIEKRSPSGDQRNNGIRMDIRRETNTTKRVPQQTTATPSKPIDTLNKDIVAPADHKAPQIEQQVTDTIKEVDSTEGQVIKEIDLSL